MHRRVPLRIPRAAALQVVLHRVGELHQKGDRGVEAQLVVVLGHPTDGLRDLPPQYADIGASRRGAFLNDRLRLQHQPPHALQKLDDPVQPSVVPFDVLFRRSDEHLVHATRIGTLRPRQLGESLLGDRLSAAVRQQVVIGHQAEQAAAIVDDQHLHLVGAGPRQEA